LDLSIILTIGKYALLVALYAFVLVIFRGLIHQLAADSTRPRESRRGSRATRRAPVEAPDRRPAIPQPAPPVSEPAPEPPIAAPEPVALTPEAEAEPIAPHLRVVESDDDGLNEGEELPLSAAVTIGRSDENSVRLDDRFISSRHALICLRDGRRLLVDRGSTNGTFVNGERVDDEIELRDGDRIALGNTVFEYHEG